MEKMLNLNTLKFAFFLATGEIGLFFLIKSGPIWNSWLPIALVLYGSIGAMIIVLLIAAYIFIISDRIQEFIQEGKLNRKNLYISLFFPILTLTGLLLLPLTFFFP